MNIGNFIQARVATKQAKATAADVAAKADADLLAKTTADDSQEIITAKALFKVGPTVIGSTLYESGGGAKVAETTVNGPDADVPEDPPTAGATA